MRRVVHGEEIEVDPAVIGVEHRGENVFVADEAGESRDGFGIGGKFAERVGYHGGIGGGGLRDDSREKTAGIGTRRKEDWRENGAGKAGEEWEKEIRFV